MSQNFYSGVLLLDVATKVLLLLLLTWSGAWFMRKRSAAAQHRWWTLGFFGCLIIPLIGLVSPTWTLPVYPDFAQFSDGTTVENWPAAAQPRVVDWTAKGNAQPSPQPLQATNPHLPTTCLPLKSTESPQVENTKKAPDMSHAAVNFSGTSPPLRFSWMEAILIIWVVGVVLCWLRSVRQHVLLRRLLSRCAIVNDAAWNALLIVSARSLGLGQQVALLKNEAANSPVSAGVWKPVVVLPEDAELWSPEHRQSVLLHELAHVARRDVLTQTVAGLVCGLHWFNPLCWYGLLQMRKLRELACDDLVLSSGQRPSGYADVLLEIARSYHHQNYSTAVGMAHSSNVENRIMAILDRTRRHVSLSRTASRLLLVLAVALVGVVGTAQLRSQAEPAAIASEKESTEVAEEKFDQDANEPIRMSIVIAEHLMLLEGREVITWDQLDAKMASLPEGTLLRPEFYFTNGAHRNGQYEKSKAKMWELHRKHGWQGRSEGSLWPSAGARYDLLKTAADLVRDEERRLDIRIVDHQGQPIAKAEVLLMPPVDESVSFKEHHVTLVDGRVNNRIEYEMTLSDELGKATLYPPSEGNYYLLVLHPSGGFAVRQGEYVKEQPEVRLLQWASLLSKLELKQGEKQHASLSTKVPEAPGLPTLVFNQHWNESKEATVPGLYGFTHVPPLYNTSIQRSFPDPDEGSTFSLNGATVSLLPGETRQLDLGPLSDAQREHLEGMRRRSEERQRELDRQMEKLSSHADEQSLREMSLNILDESGQPLAGAKLYANRIRPADAEGERIINTDLVADEVGLITLPIDRNLDRVKLWAWSPGKVAEFVWLNRGPEQQEALLPENYEFRLAEGTTIGGLVVDQDNKPIANVHVRVQAKVYEPFAEQYSVTAKPIVCNWLTDSFYQPKIKTDAEGRWRLENVPGPKDSQDHEFSIKLEHPDYTSDSQWGGLQRAQGVTAEQLRNGDATIVMSQGTYVEGKVVDLEGHPITHGWVVWHDEPYFTQGVWETGLDEQGAFQTPQLSPGEHPITVIAPGYAAQRLLVNVEPGMGPLRFELKAGNRIEIRIVDHHGAPIPKASVYLGESSDRGTWNGTNALHSQGSPGVEYGVPRKSDEEGVYTWDWAPEGPVRYSIGAKGFAGQKVSLVAKSEPHVVRLSPARVAFGQVTDAKTGKAIEEFLAMPVIVFGPNNFVTRFVDRKMGRNGQYELPLTGSGNPDSRYRVRFEVDGYRTVISKKSFGPQDGRVELNIQLESAPARKGRAVDADGNPVAGATVIEGTLTWVPRTSNGEPDSYGERIERTDQDGRFVVSATNEPVLLRVIHDAGMFEKLVMPEDEAIGGLQLQPWASISGRLIQEGQPIADQAIYFRPLVQRGLGEARFQDSYYATTSADGSFSFERLPPGFGGVRTSLGPWQDSPLTSGESLTLELKPGENREVVLGGEGAVLTGQVVATGRDEVPLDANWSLNYLISRDRGLGHPYPADFPTLSFDPSDPMQLSWSLDPHFNDWLATRENHFVKLTPEGDLRVTGVAPGEYDLVIRLYEQPAGCLVETVGEKIVPIRVAGEGEIDLGRIQVPCRAGPRVGSDMRAFEFVDTNGRKQTVNDMAGRFVLMHVWASWCGPCLQSMPDMLETSNQTAAHPVTFVGLNVDQDPTQAKSVAEQKGWNWSQNYLGDDSDMARQLAISSVPTYYLIGPDGLLAASATEWTKIKKEFISLLDETRK